MNPTNLFEYYKSIGQSLPPLSQRGQLFQQYGLGSANIYAGSVDQNTALLKKLLAGQVKPAPTPTTPVPTPTPTPTPQPTPNIGSFQGVPIAGGTDAQVTQQIAAIKSGQISSTSTPTPPTAPTPITQNILPDELQQVLNANRIYEAPSFYAGLAGVDINSPDARTKIYNYLLSRGKITTGFIGDKPVQQPGQPSTPTGGDKGTTTGGTGATTELSYYDTIKNILKEFSITPNPNVSPVTSFADTYRQVYEQLGLDNIRTSYETATKEYKKLNTELNNEIAEVNNNPWISEGLRSKEIGSLQEKYASKIDTTTRKLNLYQSMFNQGQQEAQFVAGKTLELSHQGQIFDKDMIFKAIDLAEKQVAAKVKTTKPETTSDLTEYEYAVKQGYKGSFIEFQKQRKKISSDIKPPESSTGANYNTRLNQEINTLYSGRYGTSGAREKVLSVLKKEFPSVDVAKDVYNRIPDGYEKNIKPEGRMTASTIDQTTMSDLLSDIKQGATLQQLYSAYAEISPSLIQSIYYNQ